ncbi:hypothetical protein C2857_006791 [Epichloe festucae Fl1]|uniref:Uncharacterized protein n=1 Tax=Epichloe festucae (strain Fl1) TaxID=877507 RepID=A0A7S9PSV1_EPIFF|nr:hypothetical protein C2857_006791 [Epichloe festucae Fl1]
MAGAKAYDVFQENFPDGYSSGLMVGDPFQFGPVSTTLRGNFAITAGQHACKNPEGLPPRAHFVGPVHSASQCFGPPSSRHVWSSAHRQPLLEINVHDTYALVHRHRDVFGVVDIYLEKSWRSEGDYQVPAATDSYQGRMALVNERKKDVSNLVENAFSSFFLSSPPVNGWRRRLELPTASTPQPKRSTELSPHYLLQPLQWRRASSTIETDKPQVTEVKMGEHIIPDAWQV